MTSETKVPQEPAGDDAIARYRKHDNPFGEHPNGIGPTLGEDLDGDEPPVRRKPDSPTGF